MSETTKYGQIIRNKREQRKLSLRKAADLSNLSEKCIERIELGDSDPKLSNVLKLAAVYEMDLGELNSCIPVIFILDEYK